MIAQCPICGGNLTMEQRPGGLLGRSRGVVRCDGCRSVLRRRGRGRWRYAIDFAHNPALYARLNGKTFTEAELEALLIEPPSAPESPPPVTVGEAEEVESSPQADSDQGGGIQPREDEPFEAPRFIENDDFDDGFIDGGGC